MHRFVPLALVALGHVLVADEGAAQIEDLLADLKSPDAYVRGLARRALATNDNPKVVGRLAALVKGDDPRLRREAMLTLGEMGPRARAAVPALREVVQTGGSRERRVATDALARIEPSSPLPLATIRRLLASDDPAEVRTGLRAASKMKDGAAALVPDLVALLDTKEVAEAALATLTELGPQAKASEPALLKRLAPIQRPVVDALRERGAESSEFRSADAQGDAALRALYAHALASIEPASEEALRALLQHATIEGASGGLLREEELVAIARFGPRVARLLVREWPAFAPGGDAWLDYLAHHVDMDEAWRAFLASDDLGLRSRVVELLGRIRTQTVVPHLVRALEDSTARVRRAAATALGGMGADADDAVPALIALAKDKERRCRLWAVQALGRIVASPSVRLATRAERSAWKPPNDVERAISAGLAWLVTHQDDDGKWDSDDFIKHDPVDDKCDGTGGQLYDAGVTGLAVLALLGAGHTGAGDGSLEAATRKGLRYLTSAQDRDGVFGPRATHSFMYNHAIATCAMAEACALTRATSYGRSTVRAVRFIQAAQNDNGGWRYEPRGGESDTSITAWCVMALKSAELAGLEIDPNAFEGARQWIDKMTGPNFGQVGYDYPGGASARPEGRRDRFPPEKSQAMTAAGILTRILLGEDPRSSDVIRKGAHLCIDAAPNWSPDDGSIDLALRGARAFSRRWHAMARVEPGDEAGRRGAPAPGG